MSILPTMIERASPAASHAEALPPDWLASALDRARQDKAVKPAPVGTVQGPLTPVPTANQDAKGRFTPGNKAAVGNPFNRRVAALRKAFSGVATEERLRQLAEELYAKAMGGDWAAAKLFLLYVIGKPAEPVDPDQLDNQELKLIASAPGVVDLATQSLGMSPADAVDVVRMLVACSHGEHPHERFLTLLRQAQKTQERPVLGMPDLSEVDAFLAGAKAGSALDPSRDEEE